MPPMKRTLALLYGIAAYILFVLSCLWAIGWIANVPVGGLRTIDSGTSEAPLPALLIDALLLGLFAVQHSVMARPVFKRWFTRVVDPSVERSTYVLLSSLLLFFIFAAWRTVANPVWQMQGAGAGVLWGIYAIGWLIVLLSTFMISHTDLFGLNQVWAYWQGRPAGHPPFMVRGLYRLVRHPLMLGFVITFWATPVMSGGHLFFAVMTTAYIVIALQLEEHDLRAALGEPYRDYQRRVPMLLPFGKRAAKPRSGTAAG
jgi:methanethiol S-methyltransferase